MCRFEGRYTMLSLVLRNLIFTILQPGVVTVLVPYLILRWRGYDLTPDTWQASHFVGIALMVVGTAIVLTCVMRFVTDGKGTISPVDPTKKLVIRGLYRYSRNPMYVGATTLLVGEAIFWWSPELALYAAIVFVAFNLVIILHEEPRLRREFGEEYRDYVAQVRRWV